MDRTTILRSVRYNPTLKGENMKPKPKDRDYPDNPLRTEILWDCDGKGWYAQQVSDTEQEQRRCDLCDGRGMLEGIEDEPEFSA